MLYVSFQITMGSAPSTRFCDECKQDALINVAYHYCSTCRLNLCSNCRSKHSKTNEDPLGLTREKTAFKASDEINDCVICEGVGRENEANFYCKTCQKFLCLECKNQHRKSQQSKDHVIQDLAGVSEPGAHKIIDLPRPGGESRKANLLSLNIIDEFTNNVNVKLPDDRHSPKITGCTFLKRGELIVCDFANSKVLLLNSDLTSEVDYKRFPNRPWDVAAINQSTVVVTFPSDRSIIYIQIFPVLADIQKVKFDRKCFGVAVAKSKIYVTCHNESSSTGDLRELDIDGNQFRRITLEADTVRPMFQWPYYVTVNKDEDMVYVSDWKANTIIGMTINGNTSFRYKSGALDNLLGAGLANTAGIGIDDHGNLIACGCGSNNVIVITNGGKYHKTLLKSGGGLNKPHCIALRHDDGTLVVGGDKSELLIFKLA